MRVLAPTPFASFLFTSPPVRHRVPPGSERALPHYRTNNGEPTELFVTINRTSSSVTIKMEHAC